MKIRRMIYGLALALSAHAAVAQTKPTPVSGAGATARQSRPGGEVELSDAEKKLVAGSREAILKAGFGGAYFDEHFRLASVVDRPGDRRVVWRFTLGEYETTVSDALGFYTDEKGKRVDTHTAATLLRGARDVTQVIPRRRAEAVLTACIGRHDAGAAAFQPSEEGPLALVFVAYSVPRESRAATERRERRERRERAEEARRKRPRGKGSTDPVGGDDDEGGGPPIYVGSVNLETGRCTKGVAISDHPAPQHRER